MKPKRITSIIISSLLTLTAHLHAQDDSKNALLTVPDQTPSEDKWQHNATLYGWLSGIEGDIGFNGLPPQEVDLPFKDILDNLHMAGFLSINGFKGNWGYFIDAQYISLDADDNGPRQSADLDLEQFKLTAAILYRIWHNQQTSIYAYGTLQYFYIDTDLKITGPLDSKKFSHSEDWIDPVIGFKMRHDFNDKWFCKLWGEVGGFGVSSDICWQAIGMIGYNFNDCWALGAGYRHQYIDYEDDGFVYDTDTSGPMIGLTYKF